jgi:hypothetical protein
MKALTAIALTVVITCGVAMPAAGYEVVSGHPRLFVTSADVAGLRAKCAGPMAEDYAVSKNWADDHMSDSLPLSSIDAYHHYLCTYSFLYLVTQDVAYAGRAKVIAQSAMGQGYHGEGFYTAGLAIFFDWCYPYLTSAERQTFGWELGESGLASAAGINWVETNNYHSKVSRLKGLAYPGLPLYGEGIHDTAATTLCDLYREHTFGPDYVLACIGELAGDGSYYEGDYTLSVIGESFVQGCLLWKVATGEDAFAQSGNLQNMAEYLIYDVFAKNGPGGGALMSGSKQGDSKTHTWGAASLRRVLHSLAAVYDDPVAEWLALEIDALGLGWINRNERWKLLILRDPSIGTHPPTGLPNARFFSDMGTVYMRSGWNYAEASDDVYAVFRCEAMNAGHTNAHQNHILIARGNDLLAVDAGVYDGGTSSHHLNYFCRTVAHNTVTIYDPSESTFGSYANDGGQIMPKELPTRFGDASGPEYYRGEVEAFKDTEAFTYMKGDATEAYSSSKVELFTREIVYLKPDVFVILDRVKATSPSFTKRWLLHSVNQPAVSGNTATITNGSSKLVVTSVLPADASIARVGGTGHEFDTNGANYPPSQGWTEDMGAWRLEITPGANAAEHLFLTVLCVAGVSAATPDVGLVEGDEMVGVQVDGHVVLFSATGAAVEAATYEYGE